MNRSFLVGSLTGLLAGVVLTAAILLFRNSPEPLPVREDVLAPSPEVEHAVEKETLRLKVQLAELEQQLAARPEVPVPVATPEKAKPEPSPDLATEFAALVKQGIGAMRGPPFKAVLDAVKEAGPAGMGLLVRALLEGESSQERFMAAALLEGLKDAAAVPALAKALESDDDQLVRRMASHALAMMGSEAAVEPLRAAMTGDSDWGVRVNAAYGVAKLGGDDGRTLLETSYLSSETPAEYRLGILGGLADVGSPASLPIFRRILEDTRDSGYVFLVVNGLKKIGTPEARSDLERIAASEDLPQSIREAARAGLK